MMMCHAGCSVLVCSWLSEWLTFSFYLAPTCMALLSPQKSRTRASSTSLRTPTLCQTLGRRRSTSFLRVTTDNEQPPIENSEPCQSPPVQQASSPTMLAWFLSRFIQWLHIPEKHTLSWSPPSTPRTSSDDFVLPLSASAHTVSFVVPDPPKASSPLFRWQFKVSTHFPRCISRASTFLLYRSMLRSCLSFSSSQYQQHSCFGVCRPCRSRSHGHTTSMISRK